ncbi:MAG: hypothetical protein JJ975_01275 [Bacteroidia bacterium]|nr:hypothetical protein [Bacteroidia bacterium]
MTEEQHIHELIDQYLRGELFGQELDKFKIRLKDDEAFLQQVQLQKAIIQSIEANRNAELKEMLKKRTQRSSFFIPFGKRPLAIAATLLSLLAFGLVLKTMLPSNMSELAENYEDSASDEEVAEYKVEDTGQKEETNNGTPTETKEEGALPNTDEEPNPELAFSYDEVEEDADVQLSADDEEIDISRLKADEDQLDGSNVTAQRDTLLGSKNIPVWAYLVAQQETRAEYLEEDGVETTEVSKDTRKKTRRERKIVEAERADNVDITDKQPPATTFEQKQSGSLRIEYWHSIVNFKGYKFDGSKLLLFDTPQDLPLKVIQYNGSTYLKKGSTFYQVIPNNNFNHLSKVSDNEVLKILNK